MGMFHCSPKPLRRPHLGHDSYISVYTVCYSVNGQWLQMTHALAINPCPAEAEYNLPLQTV